MQEDMLRLGTSGGGGVALQEFKQLLFLEGVGMDGLQVHGGQIAAQVEIAVLVPAPDGKPVPVRLVLKGRMIRHRLDVRVGRVRKLAEQGGTKNESFYAETVTVSL